MIMKMKNWFSTQDLVRQYEDLTGLCDISNDDIKRTDMSDGHDELLTFLSGWEAQMIYEKEKTFLEIRRIEKKKTYWILQRIFNLLEMFQRAFGSLKALIPKDDFNGRYRR